MLIRLTLKSTPVTSSFELAKKLENSPAPQPTSKTLLPFRLSINLFTYGAYNFKFLSSLAYKFAIAL